MAIYKEGKLAGIVGYKQLYPNGEIYPLEKLLTGLPRIWAIRLVSNMQNKLVGKPFYNPDFRDEKTTQIDVPRFFFGPSNLDQLLDVIHRYKNYFTIETKKKQQPMEYATGSETPLLLLKYIMAMPTNEGSDNIVHKGGITRCIKTENTLCLTINDLHVCFQTKVHKCKYSS